METKHLLQGQAELYSKREMSKYRFFSNMTILKLKKDNTSPLAYSIWQDI